MTNKFPPAHLRLAHSDALPSKVRSPAPDTWDELRDAFCEVTGWELRNSTGCSSDEPVAGIRLAKPRDYDAETALPRANAEKLATALAPLLEELESTRRALAGREAELAAGVPVRLKPDERHLAERLEAILKGGAEAVGCRAAALYLLDEATTALKLRSAWGLPALRLCDPPRPLRGSVADLEALVGHAVVLEDTRTLPHWKAPENFPAAACVPVSSPSMPLGTLWVFADEPRDFSDEHTNLLEIIAGRIAAELERESLLGAGVDALENRRQRDNVSQWQQSRLPSIAPLVDGWELGAFTLPGGAMGREFFDWQVQADGQLSVAVGAGSGLGMAAALNTAALHAGFKAHSQYQPAPDQLLKRLNETVWSAGQGDQWGALVYATISPADGACRLACAGGPTALLVGKDRLCFASGASEWLGQQPEWHASQELLTMGMGDVLVLSSAELISRNDDGAFDPESLAEFIRRYRRHSLEGLLSALRQLVFRAAEDTDRDATLLAIRRLGSTMIGR